MYDIFVERIMFRVFNNLRLFLPHSASVFPSMWARRACRSGTPAGSSTVWSTASSLTDRCRATRRSEGETTPSTRSSVRRAPGSTSPEPSSWILNQPSWVSKFSRLFSREGRVRCSHKTMKLLKYVLQSTKLCCWFYIYIYIISAFPDRTSHMTLVPTLPN